MAGVALQPVENFADRVETWKPGSIWIRDWKQGDFVYPEKRSLWQVLSPQGICIWCVWEASSIRTRTVQSSFAEWKEWLADPAVTCRHAGYDVPDGFQPVPPSRPGLYPLLDVREGRREWIRFYEGQTTEAAPYLYYGSAVQLQSAGGRRARRQVG